MVDVTKPGHGQDPMDPTQNDPKPASSLSPPRTRQEEIEHLQARLTAETERADTLAADVKAAAGELLVDIPEPGTDESRMLLANVAMRRQLSAAESRATTADKRANAWDVASNDLVERYDEAKKRATDAEASLARCKETGLRLIAAAGKAETLLDRVPAMVRSGPTRKALAVQRVTRVLIGDSLEDRITSEMGDEPTEELGSEDVERTEPYEVYIKGREKVIGYACAKCHRFCSPLIYACKREDAIKAALDHAKRCCANLICNECDKDMGPPKGVRWLTCQKCRAKKDAERESKLYQEAEKIPLSEYEHDVSYHDGAFLYYESDLDELSSPYVWACYAVELTMDAAELVNNSLENGEHHDDAFEDVSDVMLERLQKYLNLWCKRVAVRSWQPDLKKAVLLPPQEE